MDIVGVVSEYYADRKEKLEIRRERLQKALLEVGIDYQVNAKIPAEIIKKYVKGVGESKAASLFLDNVTMYHIALLDLMKRERMLNKYVI